MDPYPGGEELSDTWESAPLEDAVDPERIPAGKWVAARPWRREPVTPESRAEAERMLERLRGTEHTWSGSRE